jgi:hypothetical protein
MVQIEGSPENCVARRVPWAELSGNKYHHDGRWHQKTRDRRLGRGPRNAFVCMGSVGTTKNVEEKHQSCASQSCRLHRNWDIAAREVPRGSTNIVFDRGPELAPAGNDKAAALAFNVFCLAKDCWNLHRRAAAFGTMKFAPV